MVETTIIWPLVAGGDYPVGGGDSGDCYVTCGDYSVAVDNFPVTTGYFPGVTIFLVTIL